MTNQINSRIVTVGIQVENDPVGGVGPPSPDFMLFEGLDIRAQGQKFAGAQSDLCTIQISNLTREQRKWLLTVATPLNTFQQTGRRPVLVTLSVGRENVFPAFTLFQGYCWASSVTMPPDIGVTLTSTTNNFKASALQPQNLGALVDFETITKQIATLYGLKPNFTAKPKMVANFNYTGGLQLALNKLAKVSDARVQCNNTTLSVYDVGSTVGGAQPFTLNTSTGMVSIPEATESGVKVMSLIRPEIQIGGPITIQSQVNPAVSNFPLYISTLNFHVTNRDDPFWYEIFGSINTGLQQVQ